MGTSVHNPELADSECLSVELILRDYATRVEKVLDRVLPQIDGAGVADLCEAMRYSVLDGGKRLRPALVYATGAALGASLVDLDAPAAAVELIHCYSLIHDDLPAMDNDSLRRGRPTCHIKYGEAMAILAGDALHVRAFELLASDCSERIDPRKSVQMIVLLSEACGGAGLAGGQAIDISSIGKTLDTSTLERMHDMKTGALIRASVGLGAVAAGADAIVCDRLDRYAKHLGVLFQIRDDILDAEQSTEQIGKTAGKDRESGKPTYVEMLGLQASKRLLEERLVECITELRTAGLAAGKLEGIARYAAYRNY